MTYKEKLIEIYSCLGVEVYCKENQQSEAIKEIERLQETEAYLQEIDMLANYPDKEGNGNDF